MGEGGWDGVAGSVAGSEKVHHGEGGGEVSYIVCDSKSDCGLSLYLVVLFIMHSHGVGRGRWSAQQA